MAIFICPECGAQISDRAERCVYCGYQIVRKQTEQVATDATTGAPVNNGNKKQGKTRLWRDVIRIIDKVIVAATLLIVIRYVIVPGTELRHCKLLVAEKQWSEAIEYITKVHNTECDGLLSECYYGLAEEKAAMQQYEEAISYAAHVDTPAAKALTEECYRNIYADNAYQTALENCIRYQIDASAAGESSLTICTIELQYLERFRGEAFYSARLSELAEAFYDTLTQEAHYREADSYSSTLLEDVLYQRTVILAQLIDECGFFASEKTTISYILNKTDQSTLLQQAQESIEDWRTLTAVLNAGDENERLTRAFTERTFGWNTTLIAGQSCYASATVEMKYAAVDKKTRNGNGSSSAMNYYGLPYPMKEPGISGSCSEGSMYPGNVQLLTANGAAVGLSYRIFDPNGSNSISTTLRLVADGTLAEPPEAPTLGYNAQAAEEIIAIAKSYVNARENGREFKYGRNFFYYGVNTINNENGAAMMECDTYVGMVLRGIAYEESPFANTEAYHECSYSRMMQTANPNGYGWSDRLLGIIKADRYLHGDIRYAADYAWMCWKTEGSVFSDIENAQTGDLVFWRRPDKSNFFDNISHVAILSIEDGERYVYEVTASKYSDGRIVQRVLLDDKATPAYFGRIACE